MCGAWRDPDVRAAGDAGSGGGETRRAGAGFPTITMLSTLQTCRRRVRCQDCRLAARSVTKRRSRRPSTVGPRDLHLYLDLFISPFVIAFAASVFFPEPRKSRHSRGRGEVTVRPDAEGGEGRERAHEGVPGRVHPASPSLGTYHCRRFPLERTVPRGLTACTRVSHSQKPSGFANSDPTW
jgi:hypothetical protein